MEVRHSARKCCGSPATGPSTIEYVEPEAEWTSRAPAARHRTKLSFLLSEGNKGKTRINFRGEGNVDVLDLAKQFNGGGHNQAAGAVVDGTIPEVESRIVAAAVAHIAKY
ncbi:MAG: hypothetical protein FLDDKLPJ_02684 [Phycisphaerae bacterium]|nr:hypothetical protein [Phycisphaerae bacterium]